MPQERIGPVWVTTHALTAPIIRLEQVSFNGQRHISWRAKGSGPNGCVRFAHGEGLEWHRTEEAAHARVKVLAESRAKSMEKSIVQLRKRIETGARVLVGSGEPVV